MSNFIIAIYTFSMLAYYICSCFESKYYYNYEALSIVLISLIILISPLSKFESLIKPRTQVNKLEQSKYKFLAYILISISFFSIIFFATNISAILASDLSTVRDQIARNGNFYKSSIYSKIAVLGAFLSPITQFLFFYTIVVKERKIIGALLAVSSISIILYTLNVAGRDGIVIWTLTFIAALCLFYPLLEVNVKKKLKIFLILVSLLVIPIFYYITSMRFGSGKTLIFPVFEYLGMQLYELSSLIEKLRITDYPGEPRVIIPLVMNIWDSISGTNVVDGLTRYDYRSQSLALGLNTYRFPYYIGSLYNELRTWGVILGTLCVYFVCRINMKIYNGGIVASQLLISFAWYIIIIIGVFYFYYGELVGNVFLIIPFIIYLYLSYSGKKLLNKA